jgi:hypothetical protein
MAFLKATQFGQTNDVLLDEDGKKILEKRLEISKFIVDIYKNMVNKERKEILLRNTKREFFVKKIDIGERIIKIYEKQTENIDEKNDNDALSLLMREMVDVENEFETIIVEKQNELNLINQKIQKDQIKYNEMLKELSDTNYIEATVILRK